MRPNLMRIVESIYDLEQDTPAWISGILGQLRPWIADGLGLFGFTYSLSDADELVPGAFATMGCSTSMADVLPFAVTQIGPEYVRDGYRSADAGATSEIPGWQGSVAAEMARQEGVADVWSINGRSGGTRGCVVAVNRRSGQLLPPKERRLFARTAEHLAAAYRLRERLRLMDAIERAEAVIAPGGNVLHATGDAKRSDSLDALRTGALRMDRTRGKLRESNPVRAVVPWKGAMAARWTLLEHFDSDGRRYILAREKDPDRSRQAALSPREREVLVHAALGQSNKEIAYALGIAHSTVRVLLVRAARRLDARTRTDLVRRFEERNAFEGAAGNPGRTER